MPLQATTIPAGYFHGTVAGDFDEDGFVDLALCGYGRSVLLWNRGDGTWSDGSAAAGFEHDGWTTSGTAADFDRDGDLDIAMAGYCDARLSPSLKICRGAGGFESCRPNNYPAAADLVWENLGDGTFVRRTAEAGLVSEDGYGLGVIAADFDGDGGADLFVGNDTTPNFLYWNGRSGAPAKPNELAFEEGGLVAGLGVDGRGRAEACMGIACGDVDGNGLFDLFVTNFHDETATLYLHREPRAFEDATDAAGLAHPGRGLMGWGAQFVDLDRDGMLDLLLVNGHLHDTPQWPQVYRNGGDGRFAECSQTSGPFFQTPRVARGVALGDFDGDGREDAVVGAQAGPATLLRNACSGGRSVAVRLVGTTGPRDAAGAIVRARVGGRTVTRLVSRQGGFLTSNSPVVRIGTGASGRVDAWEITWPNGRVDQHGPAEAGTHWIAREGSVPVTEPQVADPRLVAQ